MKTMKTYEGFLTDFTNKVTTKVKDFISPEKASDRRIRDMIAAKHELIDFYLEDISDFFIKNDMENVEIVLVIYGEKIKITKDMKNHNWKLNMSHDIVDILLLIRDYLYNDLTEEEIKILKRKTKAKEFNL